VNATFAQAVGRELAEELTAALARIRHCLEQLSDEQVWHRPAEAMNSIGNLLLHLAGNLRQWLLAGLGGAGDERNRPAEFSERRAVPKAELFGTLQSVVSAAQGILAAQTAEDWLRVRRIQGFDVTGLGAAINSVSHFRGHTQEIVHMTRALLGESYRFAWVPATPEQGAAG
jgi:hypothetical protein